ncbi:MAG TPA: NAD(P)-dependent oxidoreductase [Geminicoccaceae bacterium]
MIPIILDGAHLPIALVGRSEVAERRLAWLLEGGAADLAVYSDRPSSALAALAGARLRAHLPVPGEIASVRLLWIADLPLAEARAMASAARRAGVLVNVEDVLPACDFHNPSLVRRGDLLLTVSTGGKSPGLAARIRQRLEAQFGAEWGDRLERLAAKRSAWRRRPRRLDELARLTDATIDRRGWLAGERLA